MGRAVGAGSSLIAVVAAAVGGLHAAPPGDSAVVSGNAISNPPLYTSIVKLALIS